MRKLLSIILSLCIMIPASLSMTVFAYDENLDSVNIGSLVPNDVLDREEEGENNFSVAAPVEYKIEADNQDDVLSVDKNLRTISNNYSGSCGDNAVWTLKNSVLTISGSGAMYDFNYSNDKPWRNTASEIVSVVVNSGITRIGKNAFAECNNLTSVKIANTVTGLGEAAFYGCSSLKSVTLPDKVTILSRGLFANCNSLSDITCVGITAINAYAFQNTALKKVTLSKNVTDFSSLAYYGAEIESITVENGNKNYKAQNGILYSADSKTLILYPSNKPNTEFTIPSTVKTVGDSAFIKNRNLITITIPNSVETLGSSSFQQCYKLGSIKIPDSVTSADYFTFYDCHLLKSVKFGKGLKSTSYQMFSECNNLSVIDFGTELQDLGAQTFSYGLSLTNIKLPENIKTIGNGCFLGCYGLKSFTSQGLSSVPFQAFMSCESLTDVNLNDGVENIYRAAFAYCGSLKSITLPYSVKYVHPCAFSKDTAITCKDPEMRKFGINGYRYLQDISITGTNNYDYAFEVLELVNQERAKVGLSELVMNQSLMDTAMVRAAEISVCFSHTRPDSSLCLESNALVIAENVACGQKSPAVVMHSLMNSEGHKENILLEHANTIGIGCFEIDGTLYWVQNFGSEHNEKNCSKPSNKSVTQTISIATEEFNDAVIGTDTDFSFDNGKYYYKFSVVLDKSSLNDSETTNAHLYIKNGGFHTLNIPVNNAGVIWNSSSDFIASINETGAITAKNKGTVEISANLKYYNASAELNITDSSHPIVMFGDVDGDEKVTVDDVTDIQKYIADTLKFDDEQITAADVDDDSKVTIDDVTMIQKYIADIIISLG